MSGPPFFVLVLSTPLDFVVKLYASIIASSLSLSSTSEESNYMNLSSQSDEEDDSESDDWSAASACSAHLYSLCFKTRRIGSVDD